MDNGVKGQEILVKIDELTQWAAFEPNDEALWARARRSVGDFLTGLWKDGWKACSRSSTDCSTKAVH